MNMFLGDLCDREFHSGTEELLGGILCTPVLLYEKNMSAF